MWKGSYLLTYISSPIIWAEWVAFLSSLFFIFNSGSKPLRIFPVVLGFIILAEAIAIYMAHTYKYNGLVYNLLDFVWFPGYLLYFLLILNSKTAKGWVGFFIVSFLCFALFNFYQSTDHIWVATKTFALGSIYLSISASFLYYQISTLARHYSLRGDPQFWIATAMIFFFLPASIMMAGFDYFSAYKGHDYNLYGNAVWTTLKFLNPLHYALLSYAFACWKIFPDKPITSSVNSR